jgi:hypothetical protein
MSITNDGAARLYHVVAINEKSGALTLCTSTPVTHDEGCVLLGRFGSHPLRRIQLEPAPAQP